MIKRSQNGFDTKIEVTPEVSEFIQANYYSMNNEALAKHFKVSPSKIHSWIKDLGLPQRGKKFKNNNYGEIYFQLEYKILPN